MRVALKNWAAAGTLLLALGGCAGSSAPSSDVTTEAEAELAVQETLRDIEEIYYRETKASLLVAAGLEHVQESYPGVRFTREGDTIIATVGGQKAFSFKSGQDTGDADYWGGRIATTLTRIEQASAPEEATSLTALTDHFFEGVADSLDYRAHYMSPERVRLNRFPTEGGDGTLSLVLVPEDNGWRVKRVVGPDLRRSNIIREGDLLLAIAGTSLEGLSEVEVFRLLRGPAGSPIELVVKRDDKQDPLTLTVHRESRRISLLGTYPEGSVLRVVVPYLAPGTLSHLKRLLAEEAAAPGAVFTAIILDLRENMGGLLESSIALPDLFLAKGSILSTHGRHPDSHQTFSTSEKAAANSLPLVVLVDEDTASGGEIVAAALQDNGRAVIVGATTFGVGTLQTALPMAHSGELRLPWTEAVAPGGYRLDKRGVMPTICTGGDVTADELLAALRKGGGIFERATRTRNIDPEDAVAIEAFRALCPPRSDGADVSLEVARALLADPALFSQVLAAASQ